MASAIFWNHMITSERWSLRQRLLLWLLPPIVLLTGVWIGVAYAIVLYFTNLAYDRGLEDTVHTLAGQVQVKQGKINVNLPPAARRMLEFDQVDNIYFSISNAHGEQLVGNRILRRTFPAPRRTRRPGFTTAKRTASPCGWSNTRCQAR